MIDRNGSQEIRTPPEVSELTNSQVAKVLAAEDMREYAIFSLDATGRVTSWNNGAARIKGYSTEEIVGRHFSVFYPPEVVEAGYPEWELGQAAENGFFIDEGWRTRKDGSRFWAHVVLVAQRATDGALAGFVKVTRDQNEAVIRKERLERRFTDLFELTPVGVAMLDELGTVLDANGSLCDLLHCRLHQLRGRPVSELLHVSDPGGPFVPTPDSAEALPDSTGQLHRVLARVDDGQPIIVQVNRTTTVQEEGKRFWLVAVQDVTQRVREAEYLQYQATHDETTGLLNRNGVRRLLSPLPSPQFVNRIAVFAADLDNFKRVNDSLGHEGGDELLSALAQRLTNGLPPTCTPARFYGDEFLVVCSDVQEAGGMRALTAQIAKILHTVVPVRGRLIKVSASIGAAVVENDRTTGEELVRYADAAMFEAKQRGQGFVERADPVLASTAASQLTLEEQLRHAIHNDSITMHYQPIVDNDGSVVLAEALLRWSPKSDEAPLPPPQVLRVAAQGDLLRDLDRRILRTALREASHWTGPDGEPISISVNLGGLRPDMPGFDEEILAAISESGAKPEQVVLEVVETTLAELPETAQQAMSELTRIGVRFAMDDFGTGYSSLARLKDMNTQILKLDRKFVSGIGTDPMDLGITRAMVELAHTMGRECIAEGVEDADQHRLLQDIGVDAYQGYLFSKPLPPAEFKEFVQAANARPARG